MPGCSRTSLATGFRCWPVCTDRFGILRHGIGEPAAAPSFGTPADLALTRGPSIFNNSAFGLRAKWLSADRTVYAMGALLDGIPNDPARPKRTAIRLRKAMRLCHCRVGWMPILVDGDKHGRSASTRSAFGVTVTGCPINLMSTPMAALAAPLARGLPARRANPAGSWRCRTRSHAFGRYSFSDAIRRPSIACGISACACAVQRPADRRRSGNRLTHSRLASKWRPCRR